MGWGSLGELKFSTLGGPTDFSDKQEAEYAEHPLIGGKPRLEFVGSKPEEIELKIVLHAMTCENPEATLLSLKEGLDEGVIMPLVIGEDESGIYAGEFVLLSVEHNRMEQWPNGKIRRAEVTLKLKEWTDPPELRQSERKTPPAVKKAGRSASPAVQERMETNKKGEATFTILGAK